MTQISPKSLTVFSLTMVNVAIIGSLNFWSFLASYGFSSAFFFALSLLCFILPLVFASSELTSSWRKPGGLYLWLKEAFGRRAGFVGMWIMWLQVILWLPIPLMWIGSAFAHAFFPPWIDNTTYNLVFALLLIWVSTLVLFRGINALKILSIFSVVVGYFLPGLIIIVLGFLWFYFRQPQESYFSLREFRSEIVMPSHWAFFIAVIYSMVGVEMSSLHMQNVKNPKTTFPKAIIFASILVAAMAALGMIALSSIDPQKTPQLFVGTYHSLIKLVSLYHAPWLSPVFAWCIGIGIYAMVVNWLAGPVRGLLCIANDGDLPPYFRKANAQNMPTNLLIAQGVISSILCSIYVLIPNFNRSYWILVSLITILYMLLYALLFCAVIWLRYKKPQVERPFKIPGGMWGVCFIMGLGCLTSIVAFCLGFIRPQIDVTVSSLTFFLLLAFGTFTLCLVPWFILLFKKPHWNVPLQSQPEEEKTF